MASSIKILTEAELEAVVRQYQDCEPDLEDFNAEGALKVKGESVQDHEFVASDDSCGESDDDLSSRK